MITVTLQLKRGFRLLYHQAPLPDPQLVIVVNAEYRPSGCSICKHPTPFVTPARFVIWNCRNLAGSLYACDYCLSLVCDCKIRFLKEGES